MKEIKSIILHPQQISKFEGHANNDFMKFSQHSQQKQIKLPNLGNILLQYYT